MVVPMQFFKSINVAGLLLIAVTGNAFAEQNSHDWLSQVMSQQKAVTQELQQSGQLEDFTSKRVEKGITKYIKTARRISTDSQQTQRQIAASADTIFENAGLEQLAKDNAQRFEDSSPNKTVSELMAIFVSFSMSDNELRDAFIEADQHGAELYFNGMHPQDQQFTDTMGRIKRIMKGLDIKPRARFHPRAFTELNVSHVPVIIRAQHGNVAFVAGLLNFDWLTREMAYTRGLTNLGKIGPTSHVIEENIIDVMKRRLAQVDIQTKKREAVANFWKKKEFVMLPRAEEPSVHYINPTVRVTNDISNRSGELLAQKGQVLNPLDTALDSTTYYLFDATSEQQTTWARQHVGSPDVVGRQMFLTAALDRSDGWDHLSRIRKTFNREIYLLPEEMVNRFHITSLPAVVSTDLDKRMLRIEHIYLEE